MHILGTFRPCRDRITPISVPAGRRYLIFAEKFGLFLLKNERRSTLCTHKKHRMWGSILSLITIAALLFPALSQAAVSQQDEESLGLIQVISPRATVTIPKVKGFTARNGDTLPLFQENEKYFIAVAENLHGEEVLVAFPRMDFQKRAVAWVTAQKALIFAQNSTPKTGKLYLRKGENLPVLSETKKTYQVNISRYGEDQVLEIPKKLKGIHYRESADLPPELHPRKQVKKITLADLPPRPAAAPPASTGYAQKTGVASLKKSGSVFLAAAREKASSVFTPKASPSSETKEQPSLEASTPNDLDDTRTVHYRPKEAYQEEPGQRARELSHSIASVLHKNATAMNVVLLSLLVVAAGYVRHQKSENRRMIREAQPSAEPDVASNSTSTPSPAPAPPAPSADAGQPSTFTGSLDVFRIKDLVQFLHNSSSTGVLNLEVDGISGPGRVILNMGEVKHATYNGKEGTAAFLEIFGIHNGTFRFQLSQQLKTQETIHTETSELIDETAKLVQLQNEQKIINFGQAG